VIFFSPSVFRIIYLFLEQCLLRHKRSIWFRSQRTMLEYFFQQYCTLRFQPVPRPDVCSLSWYSLVLLYSCAAPLSSCFSNFTIFSVGAATQWPDFPGYSGSSPQGSSATVATAAATVTSSSTTGTTNQIFKTTPSNLITYISVGQVNWGTISAPAGSQHDSWAGVGNFNCVTKFTPVSADGTYDLTLSSTLFFLCFCFLAYFVLLISCKGVVLGSGSDLGLMLWADDDNFIRYGFRGDSNPVSYSIYFFFFFFC
jgi:hypothetical protein